MSEKNECPDCSCKGIPARESLSLTKDEARAAMSGRLEGFRVTIDKIIDKSRWACQYELVIMRLSDGRFFRDYYSAGSTEQQDESPWEYDEPDFKEVYPVTKEVIDYI